MNKFVQLSIMQAALASGACQADDAGLCKPMCAEENAVATLSPCK